jgi:hypothetical protein
MLRVAYDALDNGYKFDAEYFGSVYKFLEAARSNKSPIGVQGGLLVFVLCLQSCALVGY